MLPAPENIQQNRGHAKKKPMPNFVFADFEDLLEH